MSFKLVSCSMGLGRLIQTNWVRMEVRPRDHVAS